LHASLEAVSTSPATSSSTSWMRPTWPKTGRARHPLHSVPLPAERLATGEGEPIVGCASCDRNAPKASSMCAVHESARRPQRGASPSCKLGISQTSHGVTVLRFDAVPCLLHMSAVSQHEAKRVLISFSATTEACSVLIACSDAHWRIARGSASTSASAAHSPHLLAVTDQVGMPHHRREASLEAPHGIPDRRERSAFLMQRALHAQYRRFWACIPDCLDIFKAV
jgi:hypothetical protein